MYFTKQYTNGSIMLFSMRNIYLRNNKQLPKFWLVQ